MLNSVRFSAFPIKLNYNACPMRRPVRVAPTSQLTIGGELREGLIQAYTVLVADYNDQAKSFREEHYISPRLGHTMDALREVSPIVLGTIRSVALVSRSLADGYVEERRKIGGLYSAEEVLEQLIAGFCGPESPMWHHVPQKEVIDVRYVTTCQRDDVLQFERDFDKDGEWVLANINDIIAKCPI